MATRPAGDRDGGRASTGRRAHLAGGHRRRRGGAGAGGDRVGSVHLARPAWLAPQPGALASGALAELAVGSVIGIAAGPPAGPATGGSGSTCRRAPPCPLAARTARTACSAGSRASAATAATSTGVGGGRQPGVAAKVPGPGTFEFWWARNGTKLSSLSASRTRCASRRSLIIGFALRGGLLAFRLGAAIDRWRGVPIELRIAIAVAGSPRPHVRRPRMGLGDGPDRLHPDGATRGHRVGPRGGRWQRAAARGASPAPGAPPMLAGLAAVARDEIGAGRGRARHARQP
jgi:hypothetical protein